MAEGGWHVMPELLCDLRLFSRRGMTTRLTVLADGHSAASIADLMPDPRMV